MKIFGIKYAAIVVMVVLSFMLPHGNSSYACGDPPCDTKNR